MKLDKLMLKDLGANLNRGLKLVRMLNFDRNADIGPIRAEIATSSACNYQCCFCHSHSYLRTNLTPSVIMSDDEIHTLINDLRKLKVKELLFSGNGEPLLCKGLINEIKQSGKYFKIEILSNGSSLDLVDEELFHNLAYLTISLNSGNGASHQLTHGYKGENRFPEITRHIERILKYDRASDKIKLNYVITTDNINELDDFFKKAIDWDVTFMARPVAVDFAELKPKELNEAMLRSVSDKAQDYLRTKKLTGKITLSFQLLSRACDIAMNKITSRQTETAQHVYPCYMSFIQPYITAGGDVLLCSEGAELPLGNINRESFLSIWQNKEKLAIRLSCTQMHRTKSPVFNACVDCANVLYHSTTFHGIYSRIPVLPGRLAAKKNLK
jgi:MoaA/NifB/PqqE/SkfB family radical SAM enzyme